MCDYDSDFQMMSERNIRRTRSPHECSSCLRDIPAGSAALYWAGKQDGDFCDGYICWACEWSTRQADHSPTHLCYGWAWGMDDDGLFNEIRFDYIAAELGRGVEPAAEGVLVWIRTHLIAEAGDDSDARDEAQAWAWPAAKVRP